MKKKLMALGTLTLSLALIVGCSADDTEKDKEKEETPVEETAEDVNDAETNDETVEEDTNTNEEDVTADTEEADKETALQVVLDNAKFAQEEDVEKYMATMNISEEFYEQTVETTKATFEQWDIEYSVELDDFVEVSEDQIKVRVFQTNKKVGGEAPYNDNISTVVHTVSKVDGEWLLTASELLDAKPLEVETETNEENDSE